MASSYHSPLRERPRDEAPPEPITLHPRAPFRQRAFRAVSTPVLAGAGVFLAVLLIVVATVTLRSPGTVDAVELSATAASDPAVSVPLADAESGSAAADAPVFVHVVGEVRAPGVVELPAGARVEAALDAAGGATEQAVLAGVNLARAVVDGEQIIVPDSAQPVQESTLPSADGTVNVNTADAAALETLPGVGPALAQRIIEWRDANGSFGSVDQLVEVSGIGQKTLDGMRDLVTIG